MNTEVVDWLESESRCIAHFFGFLDPSFMERVLRIQLSLSVGHCVCLFVTLFSCNSLINLFKYSTRS